MYPSTKPLYMHNDKCEFSITNTIFPTVFYSEPLICFE